MRLIIALLLPWLAFFTIGRPFSGIICLILQLTLIGWIPAAIWAVYALSQYNTDKKIDKALAGVSDAQSAGAGAPWDGDWRALVAALGLQPHPEGGHYREVFRSGIQVPFGGVPRSAGTSIYYLLAQGAHSAWHRIDADEVWCFHAGGLLNLHVLLPDGALLTHRLGDPLRHPGAAYQAVAPAGCWFAAELPDPDDFVLAGCIVAPGFEFSAFQLASETDLNGAISRHGAWVRRLLAG